MTGNIVSDFFLYIGIASIGGGLTYGAWRLLIRETGAPDQKPDRHRG